MKNSTMDRAKGTARELKGEAKQAFGKATNNPDTEAQGNADRIGGKVQRKVGEVEKVLGD